MRNRSDLRQRSEVPRTKNGGVPGPEAANPQPEQSPVICPLCYTADNTRMLSPSGGSTRAAFSEKHRLGYLPWNPPEWKNRSTIEDDWNSAYRVLGAVLLLIPAVGFAYVGVTSFIADGAATPLYRSEQFAENVVLIVLAAAFLLIAVWLLLSPAARNADATVQKADAEYERQYEEARKRWTHLYYCEKHRIVFVPGLPSYADAGDPAQIEALLYL